MKKILLLLFLLAGAVGYSQQDTSRLLRAFPITDYITDLGDSVKVVQLLLPDDVTIAEKQIGLLRGLYRDKHADTVTIGAGRCQLIKGQYYYFTVDYKASGTAPREGDLLYVFVKKPAVYRGEIINLAAQFIGLQDVYGTAMYDRYKVFTAWTKQDEERLLDSALADIRFTADYFLKNSPEMNIKIKSGSKEGKPVLNTMLTCTKQDILDFFRYIQARPRLYAGHEWKVSEIFATWLSEGGPVVLKD